MAFNNHIKEELEQKTDRKVMTVHGYGLYCLGRHVEQEYHTDITIDYAKMYKIVQSYAPDKKAFRWEKPKKSYRNAIKDWVKLVNLSRSCLIDTPDRVIKAAMLHGIEPAYDWSEINDIVLPALREGREQLTVIDPEDMVYLPVYHNLFARRYQYVLPDEFQDFSPAMEKMLLRMCKKFGTIIAVGDDFQAIYAFRGSYQGMMDKFAKKVKAETLPLTVCYRCPQTHIALAQEINPAIIPYKDDEGEIGCVLESDFVESCGVGDLVICRTTAPLLTLCLKMIGKGYKATVRGRDIGEALIQFLDNFKSKDLLGFQREVIAYKQDKIEELEASGDFHLMEQVDDKCAAVLELLHQAGCPEKITKLIREIFDDTETPEIVFSTVHRSKGLEADTVWIVRGDLMPHPMGSKGINQEKNIELIAYTRSKQNLYFVVAQEPWETDQEEDLLSFCLSKRQARFMGYYTEREVVTTESAKMEQENVSAGKKAALAALSKLRRA